jgi:ATP-dependent DNA helicase RecG
LVLFGENPNRRLPQAGVTAVAFPGLEKEYNTIDDERIRGPLVSILSKRGRAVDKGVIDRTVDFVARNMGSAAWLEGGRRRRKGAFPLDAVREAVVNAVTHRDYAREGTDIEVSLYKDRLEVISPGRLPNGVTVEKMREGVVRVARNELLKEILRDYGYVEHYGMGVRNRIIQSMRAHNGTEPDLIEDEDRFLVRLWKEPKSA